MLGGDATLLAWMRACPIFSPRRPLRFRPSVGCPPFERVSAAPLLFPLHVAAAALAHPDNCTVFRFINLTLLFFFVDLISTSNALALRSRARTCCYQALDRLVSSSSTHCCASADDLSPGSPPGVLLLSDGSLILEVGFTLRCLQRLSHPHFASLLCRWHDNSCTSGASIPVLSY